MNRTFKVGSSWLSTPASKLRNLKQGVIGLKPNSPNLNGRVGWDSKIKSVLLARMLPAPAALLSKKTQSRLLLHKTCLPAWPVLCAMQVSLAQTRHSSYKTLTKSASTKTAKQMSRSGTGGVHVTTHGTSVTYTSPTVASKTAKSLSVMVLVKAASVC